MYYNLNYTCIRKENYTFIYKLFNNKHINNQIQIKFLD